MTRIEELSECLVEKYGVSKQQASQFAADFFAVIRERLETEKLVKVKGLGTFKLAEMSSRESIDVNTGERITLDGRLKITFTPENGVKERINSPFSSFETMDIEDNADFSEIDSKYSEEAQEPALAPEPALNPEPEVTPSSTSSSSTPSSSSSPSSTSSSSTPSTPSSPSSPSFSGSSSSPSSTSSSSSPSSPTASGENLEKLVRQVYQDEALNSDIKGNNRAINRLSWLLGILLVAVLIVLGVVCYTLFVKNSGQSEVAVTPKVQVVEKAHVVKKADVVESADTVQSREQKPVASKTNNSLAPIVSEDPRVRTGAYVIIGVDKTVTVNRDQSLAALSKYYLGDGMECYIEVLNPGKKMFHKGDKVKLPKLETKRHWRKTHKQ